MKKIRTLRSVKIAGEAYEPGVTVQDVEDSVAVELANMGKVEILGDAEEAPPAEEGAAPETRQVTAEEASARVDEAFKAKP